MAGVTKGPRKVIPMRLFNIGRKAQRCPAWVAGCAVALVLAGCTVELLNTQPAREVAELAQPPGSVYAGWRVFQDRCAQCHGPQGEGVKSNGALAYPALAGNRAVTMASPANLVQIVLNGGFAPATEGHPRPFGMPPFVLQLSDSELADVLTYVRTQWGNQAAPVSALDVQQLRGPLGR